MRGWCNNLRGVFALVLGIGALIAAPAQATTPAGSGKAIGIGVEGTFELGISGFYDMDPEDSSVGYVDLSIGYYLFPDIALGLILLNGTTPTGQRDKAGLFAEYEVLSDSSFIPFAGGSVAHVSAPTNSDGEDARVFSVYGGLKLAITRRVALAMTLQSQWATHPVLGRPDQRMKRNRDLDLSLRLCF